MKSFRTYFLEMEGEPNPREYFGFTPIEKLDEFIIKSRYLKALDEVKKLTDEAARALKTREIEENYRTLLMDEGLDTGDDEKHQIEKQLMKINADKENKTPWYVDDKVLDKHPDLRNKYFPYKNK